MYFCSWKPSYSKSSDVLPSSLPPCLCFPSPKLQATLYEGFLVTEETSWEWIRWEWQQDTTAPSPRGRGQLKVWSLDLDSNSSPSSDSELSDLGPAAELIRPQFPHLQNGLNTIQGPMIRQNFVACDVLLTVKVKAKGTQSCPTLRSHRLSSMEFSRPEYWSGQPFPSPRDLPIPGTEPRSSTWQVNSWPAEQQGKPKIMEWVVYLFSSESSWARNQTRISCIACGFFTNWAIREASLSNCSRYLKVFGHMSVEGNSNQEGWFELWAKRYSASTQMARTKGFSFGGSQGESIFLFPVLPLPFLH